MPLFRKKAKEFEADQWFPGRDVPGTCTCSESTRVHVHTTHDSQLVDLEPSDWVIPEPNGDGYYPCKDAIFRAMCDPV